MRKPKTRPVDRRREAEDSKDEFDAEYLQLGSYQHVFEEEEKSLCLRRVGIN